MEKRLTITEFRAALKPTDLAHVVLVEQGPSRWSVLAGAHEAELIDVDGEPVWFRCVSQSLEKLKAALGREIAIQLRFRKH